MNALIDGLASSASALSSEIEDALANKRYDDWLGCTSVGSVPMLLNPAFLECVEQAKRYPGLESVFSSPDEYGRIKLYGVNGSENLVSLEGLLSSVLTYAAIAAHWSTTGFTQESFIDQTELAASKLAEWAEDHSVPIQSMQAIGLFSVYVDNDTTVELPWGSLRPAPHRPDQPEVMVLGGMVMELPVAFSGEVPEEYKHGHRIPSAMVVRTQETSVTPAKPKESKNSAIFPDAGEETASLTGLAVVLGVGQSRFSSPTFGGYVNYHLMLGGGGGPSTPYSGYQELLTLKVNPVDVETLNEYGKHIERAAVSSSMMLAGRRLLSSLNENQKEDALIDAVMVWEAIFGAKTETAFRVTSALAHTLHPQYTDSTLLELQGILNKIYDVRSKIVHGDADALAKKKAKEVYDQSWNAKRYSLHLLRKAFKWPEEIHKLPSSERSRRAILDPEWLNPDSGSSDVSVGTPSGEQG